MSLFNKDKIQNTKLLNPVDAYNSLLKSMSGAGFERKLKYNIFYQIFAFKGVKEGIGTSTLVANTALAIASLGLSVLVIDTSILSPTQDTLLKTGLDNYDDDKISDWLDLPFVKKAVTHQSHLDNRISVLSFYKRTVIDALSTNDNENLVDMAITEFHTKFDIILIDCCHELTSVNTSAMQMSQQVIQVWNDTPSVLANIDSFITNSVTLSCPMDKMRNVIYSKISRDAIGSMDGVLKQYRFKKLTSTVNSEECSLILTLNKVLWQYASDNADIVAYTNAIIDIISFVLNIKELNNEAKGTITSNDIMDGLVEGTVTKDLLDKAEKNMPPINEGFKGGNN